MTTDTEVLQPGESMFMTFNFTARLGAGDVVTGVPSVTVASQNRLNTSPPSVLPDVGAPAVSSPATRVQVLVAAIAGVRSGERFDFVCFADTQAGERLRCEGHLQIRDPS